MIKKLNEYALISTALNSYTIPIMIDGELKQVTVGNLLAGIAGDVAAEIEERTNTDAAMAMQIETLNTKSEQVDQNLLSYVDGGYVENGVAYFTHNDEVLFEITGIGGGGGGGGGEITTAVLSVQNTTGWLSRTISTGADCNVSMNWSSIEDEMPTGNGSMKITVGGVVRANINIAQGAVTHNVGPYLTEGANVVKVTISDIYGQARSINFSITVMALSIGSAFDVTSPFTGQIAFSYTPVGPVSKTVHFILDGTEIGTTVTPVSNQQLTKTIPAQTHGSHTLRVYLEATINGETVRSNELYYEFISVEDGVNTPIIASGFRQTTIDQFSNAIIDYMVYDPSNLTAEVTLAVNGTTVSTQTVGRTQQTWSYKCNDPGALVLTISTGGVTKTINLTVEALDIDVEPVTSDLELYLSSYGRSNNEQNPGTWVYEDIEATFSNFNFASDGWQFDDDRNTVLRVAGDARLTIPFQIFANDFRTTGKTIEIEFATKDVRNYDSTILSCMSGGRGLQITAQKALMKSEQSEISTQYKEDEHVRVAFVTQKRSENRLLFIYINGIMSGVVQYPDTDDFSQRTPAGISVGSNDCTIDLYCIRVYNNDLTRHQVLSNWIADTQNAETMLERYNHNNVYDEYGNIVIAKLPKDLPYMIITAAELPQYKGDKKTVSVSYVDPVTSARSFTADNVQIDVQGTSSQYYARKNYKMKYKGGFEMENGSHADDYALRVGEIATDTFTMKADVASSEGANNVELVRLYNSACPYKTPAQQANANVRQGIDGFPCVIFWDNGSSTSFMGRYNFNHDKGTPEIFGFTDGDESWEILNNTSNRVLWKSDDFESTITDESGKAVPAWQSDFESRHPEDYFDYSQLKEFATWAKSTDQDQATGDALSEPVTYDGVTYTSDTAAYRLAKFKAEAGDYMELQSAMFYYLFTEMFLMVDSRAKNAFPSFIGSAVQGG